MDEEGVHEGVNWGIGNGFIQRNVRGCKTSKLWDTAMARYSNEPGQNPLSNGMERPYRYTLGRLFTTDRLPGEKPPLYGSLCAIGINPSTATEEQDDPTVRRWIGFARRWGFTSLIVVNAFALRSTDPKVLLAHPDPVGPLNDTYIAKACAEADMVLCCWSSFPARLGRDTNLKNVIRTSAKPGAVYCLGTTRDDYPKHPLYLANSTLPIPFSIE